jgi:hypothetical protein
MNSIDKTVPFSELKKIVLELSVGDRWALLKLLIELLQPATLTISEATQSLQTDSGADEHPLAQYYGCIDDETFIRHPQPEQSERESIL